MAKAKRQPTAGDMVRSLAVILIPVLIIVFLFTDDLRDHPVEAVDWQPTLSQAREEAPYPVLAPVNLPAEWVPTRVNWTPQGAPEPGGAPSVRNQWRIGYLSPEQIYFEVTQGDLQPETFIKDGTRDGAVDGKSTVSGESWERRVSPDDRTRALVQTSTEVTTIVSGDASYEALEAFAATLA